jgi:hypothetical protein
MKVGQYFSLTLALLCAAPLCNPENAELREARRDCNDASSSLSSSCLGFNTDAGPPDPERCEPDFNEEQGEPNHRHTLVITDNDVEAKQERTISIRGGADHEHVVIVSSLAFENLAKGFSVTLRANAVSGHLHVIDINCCQALFNVECGEIVRGEDAGADAAAEAGVQ